MGLSYSWKQKIVAKSLTEAELVGVNNTLGYILWAHHFMEEQGSDMVPMVLSRQCECNLVGNKW
jgi:hypothetical protein